MVGVSTECMHCSLCCGGSGGSGSGGSGGSDGSADWTQYCNLHCVMGWCFFPKQWCIYKLNACIVNCVVVMVMVVECTWYRGCTP